MTGSNTDVFRLCMLNVTCMIAIVAVVVDGVLRRVRKKTKLVQRSLQQQQKLAEVSKVRKKSNEVSKKKFRNKKRRKEIVERNCKRI